MLKKIQNLEAINQELSIKEITFRDTKITTSYLM